MDQSFLANQIGASALIVYLMQLVKSWSKVPWITTETEKVNRIASILLSGLAAIGIHAHYDGVAQTLTFTGVGLTAILTGLWNWAVSYAITHGFYKVTR